MTLPPGLSGGIRGPLGSSLTDVVNELGGIQGIADASLEQLVTLNGTATRIADALERLTGVGPAPADWPGLPEYALARLAPMTDPLISPVSLLGQLNSVRVLVNALVRALFGTQVPAEDDRFGTALSLLADLLASSVATGNNAADLALVAGGIGDAPVGSTLKDLLRSIDVNQARAADCACGESGGTFTPTTPTAACNGETGNWIEVPLVLRFDNGESAVYTPDWPTVPTVGSILGLRSLRVFDSTYPVGAEYVLICDQADTLSVRPINACLAWDFDPAGPQFAVSDNNSSNAETLIVFNTATVSPLEARQGGRAIGWTSFNSSFELPGGYAVNFAFPTGTVPNGKLWVASGENIGV